jgi:enoyl-CoA hydratase/carnithine racemase
MGNKRRCFARGQSQARRDQDALLLRRQLGRRRSFPIRALRDSQLPADLRIGIDGPFQIGLNEVKIGLTIPRFVIELARSRLTPSHFDRAVNSAVMYAPGDAVVAGFLDRVVPAQELQPTALEAAKELAGLNAAAHKATKLKSRAGLIDAVHAAIQDEFNGPLRVANK